MGRDGKSRRFERENRDEALQADSELPEESRGKPATSRQWAGGGKKTELIRKTNALLDAIDQCLAPEIADIPCDTARLWAAPGGESPASANLALPECDESDT
jgi:hypothetical protein